jgi:two-component system cell cycle response regulator
MTGQKELTESLERILIADDEESIRELLFSFLADEGYRVDVAKDGQEAMDFVRKEKYSLIITDIRMPGMSGMELLKAVKEVAPETEVIIFTGHSTEELAIKAVKYGAFDYLKKPVDDIEMITQLINRVLQKQRLQEQNQKLLESLSLKNDELNKANSKLQEIAITDPLTGLFNRRYFLSRLAEEFHRSRRYNDPFVVAMLDLDHFKQVNDSYGHQAGDLVLKDIAELVQHTVRFHDLIGRYGGEEFFLLLCNTELPGARSTAERIRKKVEKRVFVSGQASFGVTLSIGLAPFPHPLIQSIEDLIRCADDALYQAKQRGRNRVHVFGSEEAFESSQPGM